MEQRRDIRRDDGEEGRRLGLKDPVRSGFPVSDLLNLVHGGTSSHVTELNIPLPSTMFWI